MDKEAVWRHRREARVKLRTELATRIGWKRESTRTIPDIREPLEQHFLVLVWEHNGNLSATKRVPQSEWTWLL